MVTKTKIAVALLIPVIAGFINNTKNLRQHLNYSIDDIEEQNSVPAASLSRRKTSSRAKTSTRRSKSNRSYTKDSDDDVKRECLRARSGTIPPSMHGQLLLPYINLGFPKMGTSSLHAYFDCGNLHSTHFVCQRQKSCVKCVKESIEANKQRENTATTTTKTHQQLPPRIPPLGTCKPADVYAQIDDGAYFPQIELLHEFVSTPNATTFFLTFRPMEKWYHSITHWPPRPRGPHMDERLKKLNITGSPSNVGRSHIGEFEDWFCNHVTRVRSLLDGHPLHKLVEVDIEDPTVGERMENLFGISQSCWGHKNVNAYIHPEMNASEVEVSKAFRTQERKNVMEGVKKKVGYDAGDFEQTKEDDKQSTDASEDESGNGNGLDPNATNHPNLEMVARRTHRNLRSSSSTNNPPQCTPHQLSILKKQLPPDDCMEFASKPHSQRCSFTYATQCPNTSGWIGEHYKQRLLRAASSNDNNYPHQDPSFVGVFVGCNKGLDAVDALRMGSGDPFFNRGSWKDAMSIVNNDTNATTMALKGACHQHYVGLQFPLPLDGGIIPSRVYCIEPMPAMHRALSSSATKLGYDTRGLTVTHAALSKSDGMIAFPDIDPVDVTSEHTSIQDCYNEEGLSLSRKMKKKKKECVDVPMYSLDTYVSKYIMNDDDEEEEDMIIDYLNVDVEGYDGDVLLGARSTLRRVRYLEFEYNWMGSWRKQKLSHFIDLLDSEYGFTCYWPGINNSIWRITGCWLDHYDLHFWSNVACINRNLDSANDIAQRMEMLFLETLESGNKFIMNWDNRRRYRAWRLGKNLGEDGIGDRRAAAS